MHGGYRKQCSQVNSKIDKIAEIISVVLSLQDKRVLRGFSEALNAIASKIRFLKAATMAVPPKF
jgi:hypothetical protein